MIEVAVVAFLFITAITIFCVLGAVILAVIIDIVFEIVRHAKMKRPRK